MSLSPDQRAALRRPVPDLARITCLVQRQARGEAVDGPLLDLGGAWEIDLSRLGALPALHTLMLREIDELHHADALRRLPALERVLCGGTALDVELDGVSVEA